MVLMINEYNRSSIKETSIVKNLSWLFWEGQIGRKQIIDQLFSKEYTPQDDSEQAKNGDVSLYGLLDEVAER